VICTGVEKPHRLHGKYYNEAVVRRSFDRHKHRRMPNVEGAARGKNFRYDFR